MIGKLFDDETESTAEPRKRKRANKEVISVFHEEPDETGPEIPSERDVPQEHGVESPEMFRMIGNDSKSKAQTIAEAARNSGLAWAAAISLFGSVVFLLVLGWFVDLLLGSSPFGLIGGIVLGSIIGFIQFFRITSQILQNKD